MFFVDVHDPSTIYQESCVEAIESRPTDYDLVGYIPFSDSWEAPAALSNKLAVPAPDAANAPGSDFVTKRCEASILRKETGTAEDNTCWRFWTRADPSWEHMGKVNKGVTARLLRPKTS